MSQTQYPFIVRATGYASPTHAALDGGGLRFPRVPSRVDAAFADHHNQEE